VPASRLFFAAACGIALASCAVGQRPTLGGEGVGTTNGPTGDAGVDALLTKLDGVGAQRFSATYSITHLVGPVTGTATVNQEPPTTAIAVGDVQFVKSAASQTCSLSTHQCAAGIFEQKVADLSITSSFYAASPATQIRVSYKRRNGAVVITKEDIGGSAARCLKIPFFDGAETYCVANNGVIARVRRADVEIELTKLTNAPDVSALRAGG
jgi:hypothetical protein